MFISLGDSLAFPRNDQESSNSVSNSWVQLAFRKLSFQSLWFRNRGGATSKHVLDEALHLLNYLPDSCKPVYVVQCGIVDSTPRPLPPRAFALLKAFFPRRMPRCSLLYSVWGRPWVSIRKFKNNMENLLLKISSHPSYKTGGGVVILIEIQEPGPNLTKITGTFSVSGYNSILRELGKKFDRTTFLDVKLNLHPDGHHLTTESHLELASAVIVALEGLGFSKEPD